MNLKEKLANIMNGNFNKDKMTEYDRILSCSVKGETKGAFMTTDCTNVKLLPSKCKTGLIDVGGILDAEFDNSESYHHKAIIFCDKDNVICIYNSKNDSYYEDGYEFFVPAEERLYIRCNSDASYEALKNFVNQSSKYHNFVEYEHEIPRKKAFETIFTSNESLIDNIKDNNLMLIEEKNSYKELER